jgi:hypothetical protein
MAVVIPASFILDGSKRWMAIVSGVACFAIMTYAAIAGESPAILEDPMWFAKRIRRHNRAHTYRKE